VFYTDERRTDVALTWHGLRQQTEKQEFVDTDGITKLRPSRCLADFVAPKDTSQDVANNATKKIAAYAGSTGAASQNGLNSSDYAGLFAVTAGIGADKRAEAFEAAHDDYNAIMLKAIADRLAEAFAEALHHKVRTDLWGYAPLEALSPQDLIAEKYQGIRPAPGYPACPDHSVKLDMFKLLQCEDIGMGVTESLAMTPAASVSGFYLAHPQAAYFNVGKVGDDQVKDLARRSGAAVADLQRLLAPNL
jgi:5-methyltetrahydrofolate--homocysteine methyltransferase